VADEVIPVVEVAAWLGVAARNVRRLISSGELEGRRVGRDWVVDRRSVLRYRDLRPGRGRPLSARQAWATLLASDPGTVDEARVLAVMCRRRAARRPARILPSLLGDLLDHEAIVQGGGAVFNAPSELFRPQAYVRDSDLTSLRRELRVEMMGDDANVLLRVVPHVDWPFADADRVVPPVVGLVDLVDEREERWVRDRLTELRRSRTR